MKQSKTNTILHILKTFLHRRLKTTKSLLSQSWMAKTEGSGCCEDNGIFKNQVLQMSHLARGHPVTYSLSSSVSAMVCLTERALC